MFHKCSVPPLRATSLAPASIVQGELEQSWPSNCSCQAIYMKFLVRNPAFVQASVYWASLALLTSNLAVPVDLACNFFVLLSCLQSSFSIYGWGEFMSLCLPCVQQSQQLLLLWHAHHHFVWCCWFARGFPWLWFGSFRLRGCWDDRQATGFFPHFCHKL